MKPRIKEQHLDRERNHPGQHTAKHHRRARRTKTLYSNHHHRSHLDHLHNYHLGHHQEQWEPTPVTNSTTNTPAIPIIVMEPHRRQGHHPHPHHHHVDTCLGESPIEEEVVINNSTTTDHSARLTTTITIVVDLIGIGSPSDRAKGGAATITIMEVLVDQIEIVRGHDHASGSRNRINPL